MRGTRVVIVAGALMLSSACAAAQTSGRWSRLSFTLRQSVLASSGGGEAFSLFQRDLTPGPDAMHIGIGGGEVRWRMARDLHVVGGAESGARTVGSESRYAPSTTPARQSTSLDLSSLQYAGVSWTPLHWRAKGTERARLGLAAGGGHGSYRLHQWGQFADANRQLTFTDDFVSSGHGTFGYGALQLEVPVWRGVALSGDVRRQFGSAPMSADFAQFDRIDLGGTRAGVGLTITPAQFRR